MKKFPGALRAVLTTILCAVLAGAVPPPPAGAATQTAVFSGGCFWGVEAVFESLKGVTSAVAGYSGGAAATAHYEIVSTGTTGHAESVEVTYDPAQITYDQLLEIFFRVAHDPTELNRQGPDEGTQYRSVIFYTTDEQRDEANRAIKALADRKTFKAPIVTQVVPLKAFYPAEAYHQHFVEHNRTNPYVATFDLPKLADLRARFPELLKHS
jgi:peptide-methionine (S)-S-oxide reductase